VHRAQIFFGFIESIVNTRYRYVGSSADA